MKILFFITVMSHGRGGHVHSLNHIAAAMGEKVEVGIYSLGSGQSDVIKKNLFFKGQCFFNGRNYISFKKEVTKNIKEYSPDIIHCFDNNAYNILSLVISSKYKMVVNKCGGPNPLEFPFIQNLVLFSKENEEWFKNQRKFKNSSIYLIPNRVNKKQLMFDKSCQTLAKADAFCFVRIARIGKIYKKGIEDSIRLIEQIKTKGANVHLYVIGTIEDEAVLSEFEQKCQNLPVTFVTDNKYTEKASNMLYLADAVIATGRGIMEATALGKPILTPAKNAKLPILVTSDNFESFFATNFSQRNVANKSDLQSNFNNIRQLIVDKRVYADLENQSTGFFNEYFDVQRAVPKYIEVYNNVLDQSKSNKRPFMNIKYQLKTIYTFLRNGK